MKTTITAARLDRIASTLDTEAREAAHSSVVDSTDVESFCDAYLYALATLLGERSAEQCARGERWEPAAWLEGDRAAIVEAGEALEVDAIDWTHCWALYSR